MRNTWYASDWDQANRPSYAKIRRIVVRHIQVHLYYGIRMILFPGMAEPERVLGMGFVLSSARFHKKRISLSGGRTSREDLPSHVSFFTPHKTAGSLQRQKRDQPYCDLAKCHIPTNITTAVRLIGNEKRSTRKQAVTRNSLLLISGALWRMLKSGTPN